MASLQTGRDRILAAARKLFAANGFDGVTIRDIGAEAGLSNPALYRHFRDKEALGVELYRQCYGRMLAVVEAASDQRSDPLARVMAYVEAVTLLFEQEPDLVLYIDEHQVRFWPKVRHEFEGRTLTGRMEDWIGAARASGAVPSDGPVSLQIALVMGAVSHWFAMRAAGLVQSEEPGVFARFLCNALSSSGRS